MQRISVSNWATTRSDVDATMARLESIMAELG